MKTRFALMLAALVAVLAPTPASSLDYDCSPFTGGCVPRASGQPSWFDSPATIYYPPSPRPRLCPIDGPSAWTCDRRERRGAPPYTADAPRNLPPRR
jgi:hypothetical protein